MQTLAISLSLPKTQHTVNTTLTNGSSVCKFVSKREFCAKFKAENNDASTNDAHRAFYVELRANTTRLAGVPAQLVSEGWNIPSVRLSKDGSTCTFKLKKEKSPRVSLQDELKALRAELAAIKAA